MGQEIEIESTPSHCITQLPKLDIDHSTERTRSRPHLNYFFLKSIFVLLSVWRFSVELKALLWEMGSYILVEAAFSEYL